MCVVGSGAADAINLPFSCISAIENKLKAQSICGRLSELKDHAMFCCFKRKDHNLIV